MARFLKQGGYADASAAADAKVRATVEGILADIAGQVEQANVRRCGGRNVPYAQAAE